MTGAGRAGRDRETAAQIDAFGKVTWSIDVYIGTLGTVAVAVVPGCNTWISTVPGSESVVGADIEDSC